MRVGRAGVESGRLEGDTRAKVACGFARDRSAKAPPRSAQSPTGRNKQRDKWQKLRKKITIGETEESKILPELRNAVD